MLSFATRTLHAQDNNEAAVLGIDVCDNTAYIGLVLTICASMRIRLDGDGGMIVESIEATHASTSHHVFKPVSVHALW